MKTDVVLGLQWGDEGKGKIVDVLTPKYEVVARFQGGPNAGHSLEFDDMKFVLHTVPSGIFHPTIKNIIGNGVVIDPVILLEELDQLRKLGIDPTNRLRISKKAHLILPTHRIIDAASEAAKGKTKIGSTLKGIGPTYMDKTGRNGLRVGDILADNFMERYQALKNKHIELLKQFADYKYNAEEYESTWFKGIDNLKKFQFIDSEHTINKYLDENKKVLAEGAQGSLLDIDFGTYPYVTSSNTICAGACIGLGLAPTRIGEVYGIFKAYCTRVGSGPFPTELNDNEGEELRRIGREFGSTTGRPRRTGWLDLVALKYTVTISGVSQLIMTKSDVFDTFDKIKVCVAYSIKGNETKQFPYELSDDVVPVYKEFKGWKKEISKIKNYDELPAELTEYIKFIEDYIGVPLKIVSVGPNRDETIIR